MADMAAPFKLDGRTREGKARKAADARRREIADGLLSDLRRVPSMRDRIWAGNTAALVFLAEQAEARGEDSAELRRQVNQAFKPSARPAPPAPAKQSTDIRDLLAERGYRPPTEVPT